MQVPPYAPAGDLENDKWPGADLEADRPNESAVENVES